MKNKSIFHRKKASLIPITVLLISIALVFPVFAAESKGADKQEHTLPPFVKADADVVAVFAKAQAQKLVLPEDLRINDANEDMIDTLWIYYSDNTFDQYAQTNIGYELFSTGTYSLSEGADFIVKEDEDEIITINRTQKFGFGDNGPGLYDYSSSHEYNLRSLGFKQLYGAKEDAPKVEAIMGDDNELYYKNDNGVVYHYDSIWIMSDDMSFEKYIFTDDDVELYESGTYEFDETGDFRMIGGKGEENGTITLTYDYNARYEDADPGDIEPVTFDLKTLGLTFYYEKAASEPGEPDDKTDKAKDEKTADKTDKAKVEKTEDKTDKAKVEKTEDKTDKAKDEKTSDKTDKAKDEKTADKTDKAKNEKTDDTDAKSSGVIDEELETVLSGFADEYGFTDEEKDLFVEFASSIFTLMESEEANESLEMFKSNISDYYSDETVAQISEALKAFDQSNSGLEDAWDEIMQDYQYIVTRELSEAYEDIQEDVIKEAKNAIPSKADIPKAKAKEIEKMTEDMAELISASVMYNLSDMFNVFDILSKDGNFSLNENVEAFRDANIVSEEDIQAKIEEYNALREAYPDIAKNETAIIKKVNESINDEFEEAFANIRKIMQEDVDEILEGYNVSKTDKKMIVNMLLSMFDQIDEEFEKGLKENISVDRIISGKPE